MDQQFAAAAMVIGEVHHIKLYVAWQDNMAPAAMVWQGRSSYMQVDRRGQVAGLPRAALPIARRIWRFGR